jgi:hypothetical protein
VLEDIASVTLTRMRTQLQARGHTWMKKALPSEAVPAWHALDSATITATDHECFFSAMQYVAYRQQARPLANSKSAGKQWNGSKPQQADQSSTFKSKGKNACGNNSNSKQWNNPWTNSSHGAGSSATHD